MQAGLAISEIELAGGSVAPSSRADTCPVLDIPIGVMSMAEAIRRVNQWIAVGTRAHLVTFVNVHMTVEAQLRPAFRRHLQEMDLNCPDGAPVFWLARQRYGQQVAKISGPEFMPRFCEQSVALGHRHFLYGGTEGVAEQASWALQARFPGIRIAGHSCPPFRQLTDEETDEVVEQINASGADVVWVCLGCPKQEQWMVDMRDRLQARAILAVGQAFDLVAGRRQRAPELFCRYGLEWMYRLAKEPRRLWRRYLVTNLLFLLFLLLEKLEGVEQPQEL